MGTTRDHQNVHDALKLQEMMHFIERLEKNCCLVVCEPRQIVLVLSKVDRNAFPIPFQFYLKLLENDLTLPLIMVVATFANVRPASLTRLSKLIKSWLIPLSKHRGIGA